MNEGLIVTTLMPLRAAASTISLHLNFALGVKTTDERAAGGRSSLPGSLSVPYPKCIGSTDIDEFLYVHWPADFKMFLCLACLRHHNPEVSGVSPEVSAAVWTTKVQSCMFFFQWTPVSDISYNQLKVGMCNPWTSFVTNQCFYGIVSPEQLQYQVGAQSPFAPVTNTVFIQRRYL